jgi:hypothetical protein
MQSFESSRPSQPVRSLPASLRRPSKPLGTAAFRGYGLVSVSGIGLQKRRSGPWSPRPLFGVAFLLPSPCSVVRPVSSTLHAIRRSCDTRSTASSIVRRNEIDNVCRGPTLIRWEAHGEVGMCPGRRRWFPRFSRMRLMMRITSARCTRPLTLRRRDCQSRSGGSRYPKAASRVGAGRRRCP